MSGRDVDAISCVPLIFYPFVFAYITVFGTCSIYIYIYIWVNDKEHFCSLEFRLYTLEFKNFGFIIKNIPAVSFNC